jgi:alpha-L-arabinofuranosidase
VLLLTGWLAPLETTRFVVSTSHPGTFWLNQVSLFAPTYRGRPNGNRIDLMQKMAALEPSFLRMPGGNYLEGNTIAERYQWKQTIGPIEQRPGHPGTWGYRSDDGLGLLEFLEWCEDLHMQPLLAVWAGYALDGSHIDAGPDLAPYVQETLDEIQYVTGGTNTIWAPAAPLTDTRPRFRYNMSRLEMKTSLTSLAATTVDSLSFTTPLKLLTRNSR